MRLKSVKLTHLRGYRATTVIPISEAMPGLWTLPSKLSHESVTTF